MKYHLRHFENNMQIVSSLGWVLIIVGLITLFVGPIPGAVILILLGVLLVWLQLRGKRITVDTSAKVVKSGGEIARINNPSLVFMKEVKISQRVNSRGSSTNVKMYFYKGYIQDGEESHLISCNRNDKRDMEALKQIAQDLSVPFEKNYE